MTASQSPWDTTDLLAGHFGHQSIVPTAPRNQCENLNQTQTRSLGKQPRVSYKLQASSVSSAQQLLRQLPQPHQAPGSPCAAPWAGEEPSLCTARGSHGNKAGQPCPPAAWSHAQPLPQAALPQQLLKSENTGLIN